MPHHFAVSPDIHVRDLSSWFVLNTRIQRSTGEPFHLTVYDDFGELHRAIEEGGVDLIYANTADTALLVRQKGFVPIARPADASDEATVVVSADGPLSSLADLAAPLRVAATESPDVERVCRILLEPADLGDDALQLEVKRNYVLVAKALIAGRADLGFFLRTAFDELSEVTRKMLRPLVSSRIYVIGHSLLASPAIVHLRQPLLTCLQAMSAQPTDRDLIEQLGAPRGWRPMSAEEAELLIDVMDTLAS
jgi:ABC transporter, phosphonate, periplasmic substrate-binding protein